MSLEIDRDVCIGSASARSTPATFDIETTPARTSMTLTEMPPTRFAWRSKPVRRTPYASSASTVVRLTREEVANEARAPTGWKPLSVETVDPIAPGPTT